MLAFERREVVHRKAVCALAIRNHNNHISICGTLNIEVGDPDLFAGLDTAHSDGSNGCNILCAVLFKELGTEKKTLTVPKGGALNNGFIGDGVHVLHKNIHRGWSIVGHSNRMNTWRRGKRHTQREKKCAKNNKESRGTHWKDNQWMIENKEKKWLE